MKVASLTWVCHELCMRSGRLHFSRKPIRYNWFKVIILWCRWLQHWIWSAYTFILWSDSLFNWYELLNWPYFNASGELSEDEGGAEKPNKASQKKKFQFKEEKKVGEKAEADTEDENLPGTPAPLPFKTPATAINYAMEVTSFLIDGVGKKLAFYLS